MDKESIINKNLIINILGLISISLFIFIENPILKLTLALIYIIISKIYKMRVKVIPNLTLFFTILILNLFFPFGKIIYKLGAFSITLGALFSGIQKASLLIGMLYLSKNISYENFKIPGRVGRVVKDSFSYFTIFTAGERFSKVNIIDQIDNKLLNLPTSVYSNINKVNSNKSGNSPITILTIIFFALDNLVYNFNY